MKIKLNLNPIKNYNNVWRKELSDSITNIYELLDILDLNNQSKDFICLKSKKIFPIKVPRVFIKRIKKNDPKDPILLQIISNVNEQKIVKNFIKDPIHEHRSPKIPGLLHKYYNRVLIIVKTICPIHCRYCFRKHFPYKNNIGNQKNWTNSINYIQNRQHINEVILSGGDPLSAQDKELNWLISELSTIKHLKRLRIHTRFPVVIPSRITHDLCSILLQSRLKIILVTHINHPNEISKEFSEKMLMLKKSNVILLNQSVLLKGVNDNPNILAQLSNILFDNYILPYYLHILDKIEGSQHFFISEQKARLIIKSLTLITSGFLVPKLIKDNFNYTKKIIII